MWRRFLARQSKLFLALFSCAQLACLWWVDSHSPPDLSYLLFYFVPILYATWFLGEMPGLLMALACASIWIHEDALSHGPMTHWLIPYWNVFVKGSFMLLAAFLLGRLKRSYDREKQFAWLDPLTQTANRRALAHAARREIARARRYRRPLTLAYIDIDDFKWINDQGGHEEGDAVLVRMSAALRAQMRSSDMVARMGGDEFAILLPETDAEQARTILKKLIDLMPGELRRDDLPVTLSVGAVTFTKPPVSVERLIQEADHLMYSIKSAGKNGLAFKTIAA